MPRIGAPTLLRRIRSYATLQTMEVGEIYDRDAPVKMADGSPVTERNVSNFIRERLRLHHDTYILGPLDAVIAKLERK